MLPRPPFSNLPLKSGDPPFSAWGLYGEDDQLGTLNMLTAENTLAAARSEIKTGHRVSLDPPIDCLEYALGGRKALVQKVIRRGSDRPVQDDELEFNTQVGAQWDGFKHLTYLELKQFYNGVSLDSISGPEPDHKSPLGIHSWVEKGGIAGRGVLLDYFAYAQASDKQYSLIGETTDYAITAAELQDCAKFQGTEIRSGDLLFVRSGFFVGYKTLNNKEKKAWSVQNPTYWVGVEATRAMAEWLWDSGIVACAGDAPGWERIPNHDLPQEHGLQGLSLHQTILGRWGMPIGKQGSTSLPARISNVISGEIFDLEALSEECKRQNSWSFFVTSAPLHVRGGVGSPPNCIAIF